MSTTTPDVKNVTTDDAPTSLDPQITMIVTDHVANGPADGLLAYDEFAACVTLATDTITRVATEADSR